MSPRSRIELVRFAYGTREFAVARVLTRRECFAAGLEFIPDDRPDTEVMAVAGMAMDNTLYDIMGLCTGLPSAQLRRLGPDLGTGVELQNGIAR